MLIACGAKPAQDLWDHLAKGLDPVATLYTGEPVEVVRAVVSQAWVEHTGRALPEPILSRCAAAIATGVPWQTAFWANGG
jgi:hypothetical protein